MATTEERRPIKESVVQYLRDRPGLPTTVGDIAEGVGLSRQQVFNAMTVIVQELYPLVTKVTSSVYMFRPASSQVKEDYVLISDLGGVKVVRGEDGRLYRLSEIDLRD